MSTNRRPTRRLGGEGGGPAAVSGSPLGASSGAVSASLAAGTDGCAGEGTTCGAFASGGGIAARPEAGSSSFSTGFKRLLVRCLSMCLATPDNIDQTVQS